MAKSMKVSSTMARNTDTVKKDILMELSMQECGRMAAWRRKNNYNIEGA